MTCQRQVLEKNGLFYNLCTNHAWHSGGTGQLDYLDKRWATHLREAETRHDKYFSNSVLRCVCGKWSMETGSNFANPVPEKVADSYRDHIPIWWK